MQKKKRTNYSEEFRKEVLTAYFESEESISMLARRFGVKQDTVGSWVYRHQQPENQKKKVTFADSKEKPMSSKKLQTNPAEARLKDLEAELERERMRSICLDKMLDIAERELKVNIRKKYGAKQFKK